MDGLWIDQIASGIGTDKNNGLIEGLSDGVLLATTATLDATDLFVRGAQRVAVLSDNGSGTITGGTLDRCRYGLVSTGSLDAWTFDELDNGCDEPVWSKTTLAVPRPRIQ